MENPRNLKAFFLSTPALMEPLLEDFAPLMQLRFICTFWLFPNPTRIKYMKQSYTQEQYIRAVITR